MIKNKKIKTCIHDWKEDDQGYAKYCKKCGIKAATKKKLKTNKLKKQIEENKKLITAYEELKKKYEKELKIKSDELKKRRWDREDEEDDDYDDDDEFDDESSYPGINYCGLGYMV